MFVLWKSTIVIIWTFDKNMNFWNNIKDIPADTICHFMWKVPDGSMCKVPALIQLETIGNQEHIRHSKDFC